MSTPTSTSGTAPATRPTKRPAATTAPKAPKERASATAAPKRAAAPKAPATPEAPAPTLLREREPRELATATGLALAALVAEAVEALGRLPRDAERLRDEVRPIAEAAPERLRGELQRAERALTAAIDARAPRGRAVVDEFVARPEVRELRERGEALRARLQRALGRTGSDAS